MLISKFRNLLFSDCPDDCIFVIYGLSNIAVNVLRQMQKKRIPIEFISDPLAEYIDRISVDGIAYDVKSEEYLRGFVERNENICVIINSGDAVADLSKTLGVSENKLIDSKCWVTERVYSLSHKKTIEVNFVRLSFAGSLDYSDEFGNDVRISDGFYKGTVILKGGSNRIHIKENHSFSEITLSLYNSIVEVGENFVGTPGKPFTIDLRESNLRIGKDFSSNSNLNLTYGDYSIGDDVMIAKNVNIHSVSHQIGDADTGVAKTVGRVKGRIGNHVWIGSDAHLIGDFQISDGSIVGAAAVVSKKFEEKNISIGSANKILKHNISWNRSAAYSGVDKI